MHAVGETAMNGHEEAMRDARCFETAVVPPRRIAASQFR